MRLVQIGANKGSDELANYLKRHYKHLEFGLFVEANSLHIPELKKCYEEYENTFIENIAVKPPSCLDDTIELFYHTNDGPMYGVTSCKIEHIEKHIKMCPHLQEGEIKSFKIPCVTIDDLFEKYDIKDLDWLLLDVEGIDAELLLSTDWSKYNIKKIEFESIHLGDDKLKIRRILEDLNYVRTSSLHRFDEAWIKKTEVKEMDVTLYSIAKNEEKNIEKFIENSKKFSHTIVVDTGSTDNTVQLLRDAGITVHEHPQARNEFDFALARNTALSYVETDWAFSLDFNEDVDNFFPSGFDVIEKDFTYFKHLRFDDEGENEPQQSNEVHTRFHRTKNYKWIHSVHEVPVFVSSEEYPEEASVDSNIKITKKIHKSIDKELFYLSICEREHEKNPTEWYYVWFIFNHYFNIGNLQKALEFGQEFLNVSKPYFDVFRVPVFIKCSQILINVGDAQRGANYAFHALSEAMNMGEPYLSQAFSYLFFLSTKLNNPNITVFASAFNEQTLNSKERFDAIQQLFPQEQ